MTHAVKDRLERDGTWPPDFDWILRFPQQEDVLGNLAWVMKNFNSAVHDPRILSYSVEASASRPCCSSQMPGPSTGLAQSNNDDEDTGWRQASRERT